MNTKTARLIRRYITVTQPNVKPYVLRRAKRDWLRTPAPQRAAKRRMMQDAIAKAAASAGKGQDDGETA